MDWFLYDNGLRQEKVSENSKEMVFLTEDNYLKSAI